MSDVMLGELAVAHNFITRADLNRCLALQRAHEKHDLLGQILLQEGLLSATDLRALLRLQKERNASREGARTDAAPPVGPKDVVDLLSLSRRSGATHTLISTDRPPRLRRHGRLIRLDHVEFDGQEGLDQVRQLVGPETWAAFERTSSAGCRLDVPAAGRFLVRLYRHRTGQGAVFKAILDQAPDVDRLGLPPIVRLIPSMARGLVLITGPTNSGKSTTLAALIRLINETQTRHIITIEDPIEVEFESAGCLIAQREVGRHVRDFATALRETLRGDPDVIVVSRLSGPEEIACALSAAETGHLVLGTMDTATTIRTVYRILDAYPGHRLPEIRAMLASTLRLVIAQQLVPGVDQGTSHLAVEVLRATAAVSAMIRDDKLNQLPIALQTGQREGMQPMDDALADLVRRGKIRRSEAALRATDPTRFMIPPTSS